MLDAFVKLSSEIANSCAPIVSKRVKGCDTPWLTGELRKLMATRDQVKQQAIRKKDQLLFEKYRSLRNKVVKQCKKARREYYSNLIAGSLSKPDKLWKTLKKILPGKTKQSTILLKDDLGMHSEASDIANCFNRFFTNIGKNLASVFPKGIQIANPYPDFSKTFCFSPIPVSFVLKQLQTLKSSKATGLDNIDARMLKDAAECIAQPLAYIMNKSLESGIVPKPWKEARVTPIFKADCPMNPSNYRPI